MIQTVNDKVLDYRSEILAYTNLATQDNTSKDAKYQYQKNNEWMDFDYSEGSME